MSMWRDKKTRPTETPDLHQTAPAPLPPPPSPRQETPMNEMNSRLSSAISGTPRQTVLGQSVVLKGELSADEDLLIEGQFEGTLSLVQHCLTVGSNGQVKAEVKARQAVIMGTVTGKVSAREKVEIRRTGHLVGDLATGSVAIEEGAYFKGSIEILRDETKESPRVASIHSAAPHSSAPHSVASRSASGTSE